MSIPILIHEQTAISLKLYTKPVIKTDKEFMESIWENENQDFHCDYKKSAKDFLDYFYDHTCVLFLEELRNEINGRLKNEK